MNSFFYGWIIIAFFFLLMEMGSPGLFFFLSFFVGGLSSAFASVVYTSLVIQSVFFLAISGITFYILSRLVKHSINRKHGIRTNVYVLKGKHAQVIRTIESGRPGEVNVQGQIWSAYAVNGETIEKESIIEIVEVKGAYVIVKKRMNSEGLL